VLTAFGNLETALETVHQLGAFWYLEKPVQTPAMQMVLERAVEKRRLAGHTQRWSANWLRGRVGRSHRRIARHEGNLLSAAAGVAD